MGPYIEKGEGEKLIKMAGIKKNVVVVVIIIIIIIIIIPVIIILIIIFISLIQFTEVVIVISNEQLNEGQLKKDSKYSCAEDDSKPVVLDEEAGYKWSTKAKSIFRTNFEASMSTLDVVEGRKKYIAFVFVSFFTLYSYVDSFVKLLPI